MTCHCRGRSGDRKVLYRTQRAAVTVAIRRGWGTCYLPLSHIQRLASDRPPKTIERPHDMSFIFSLALAGMSIFGAFVWLVAAEVGQESRKERGSLFQMGIETKWTTMSRVVAAVLQVFGVLMLVAPWIVMLISVSREVLR